MDNYNNNNNNNEEYGDKMTTAAATATKMTGQGDSNNIRSNNNSMSL